MAVYNLWPVAEPNQNKRKNLRRQKLEEKKNSI